MRIQSKMVSILAVVSGLALTSACGEGAEGAEQQEAPAQLAPDAMKEQEAAVDASCPHCVMYGDFWGISNGSAGGWACNPTYPNQAMKVTISKWGYYGWSAIGTGWATKYNAGLVSACGGVGGHQFEIALGANAGPGSYKMNAIDTSGRSYGFEKQITVY